MFALYTNLIKNCYKDKICLYRVIMSLVGTYIVLSVTYEKLMAYLINLQETDSAILGRSFSLFSRRLWVFFTIRNKACEDRPYKITTALMGLTYCCMVLR